MSFGTILDTAIGLIFIFLLLSLITTAAQESFASWRNKRGKQLQEGLRQLLVGGGTANPAMEKLFGDVWAHGLVTNGAPDGRQPSYVSGANVATALVHVLSQGSTAPEFTAVQQQVVTLPDGPAKQALLALLQQAGGDLDALKKGIEGWFDDAMDRVSGFYKRYTQKFTIAFGVGVAVLLNVNTIDVAATLWTEPAVRQAVVDQAQRNAPALQPNPRQEQQDAAQGGGTPTHTPPAPTPGAPATHATGAAAAAQSDTTKPKPTQPEPGSPEARAQAILSALPLPIGWNAKPGAEMSKYCPDVSIFGATPADPKKVTPSIPTQICDALIGHDLSSAIHALLGWLITGLAISLGAPFWFDLLQNFINLRNTGPKPAAGGSNPTGKGDTANA